MNIEINRTIQAQHCPKVPFVSVIVPTFRDWDALRQCLEALSVQSYPHENFEVIVVNNEPSDPAPYPIERDYRLRLLVESKKGSYAARNTGIRAATGTVLAFLDSDCRPMRNWIENGVRYLNLGFERVAGQIELTFSNPSLNWVENFENIFAFRQAENAVKGVSVTANMFARRKVFEEVGFFEEAFLSGGDIEWSMRAWQCGFGIAFGETAVVRHPARSSLQAIMKKRRRVAGGIVQRGKGKKGFGTGLWVLRGILPPLGTLSLLRNRNDVGVSGRIKAWLTLYLLKVYGSFCALQLLVGWRSAARE